MPRLRRRVKRPRGGGRKGSTKQGTCVVSLIGRVGPRTRRPAEVGGEGASLNEGEAPDRAGRRAARAAPGGR